MTKRETQYEAELGLRVGQRLARWLEERTPEKNMVEIQRSLQYDDKKILVSKTRRVPIFIMTVYIYLAFKAIYTA